MALQEAGKGGGKGGIEEVADEGVCRGEFGGSVAGEEGDGGHSGAVGGFDAGGGIFEDEAGGGRDAKAGGGGEEDFGVGFAAGDVRASDDGLEAGGQAEGVEAELRVFAGGAGAEGAGEAEGGGADEGFADAGDGLDAAGADAVAVAGFFFFAEGDGFLLADGPAEEVADDGDGAEAAFADVVGVGHGIAMGGGSLAPGFDVELVGVDDDAVAVEDEGADGSGDVGRTRRRIDEGP